MRFEKLHYHHYPVFGNCRAKNKDIALKSCMCIACMCFDNIYSGFLDKLKILHFIGNYFRKTKILTFWGSKPKNITNLR